MSSEQQQEQQRREIVHKGQLQQKTTRRFGTLLRKKKTIYEDELWVILCVHEGGNGGIPHLEWYGDLRSAYDHNPLKVQDLLDCQYVNVAIGEERCMVIGFVDKTRPVLELSAPSVEERRQWVAKLTDTLRQMNCPLVEGEEEPGGGRGPRAENDYIALNELDEFRPASSSPGNEAASPHVPITPLAFQKLSLADTIPMHSSPPSSSASPPFSPTSGQNSGSKCRVPSQPNPSAAASSSSLSRPHQSTKPIAICTSTSPRHGQVSPGTAFEEEEGEDDDDDLLPPPLPPRRTQQPDEQIGSPSGTNGWEEVPMPRLPSSPIPSLPPPMPSTVGNCANASAGSNYQALDLSNRPIGTQSQQHQHQYDQLSPAGRHQYQQLARLSGDFSDPAAAMAGVCALRLSSSSSTATTNNSSSSQRSSKSSGQQHQQVAGTQMPSSSSSPRNSAQYDVLFFAQTSTSPPSKEPQINYADQIFSESMARPRRVSLSLTLLAEHVAFVDGAGKVWVAGWSARADTNLRNILHFGDEVERMAGFGLRSVQQLPEIYASTKPGVQIELVLRANPAAKVYSLTRPAASPKRELGIVLHKRKNKIASIQRASPAERAGVPARLPPYLFNPDASEVPAVITEVDGIPLSLFARNEQFFLRLDQLPPESALNITLHPADFCAFIASRLKSQLREHRRFVHDQ